MSRTRRKTPSQICPKAHYGKKYLRRPKTTQELRLQELILDIEAESPVNLGKRSRITRNLPSHYDDIYISAYRELHSEAKKI